MTPSLIEGIREVARLLGAWGRPAAVVGGMAIIARVRPRFTDDLDVAVVVPTDQVDAFADLAFAHGFVFNAKDRQFFREAGLLPMRGACGVRVDVMVADDALLESTVGRASLVDLGGVVLPVASAEDLLLMKLDANRLVDLDDAIAIKDALGSTLDRVYLRRLADQLGLSDRLHNLLGPG